MSVVLLRIACLVGVPCALLAWGGAHTVITESALRLLPEWQREFLGDEEMGRMCREYCLYPDMYHGDNKAKIDPYIMPELRKAVMPLHLEAPEVIEGPIFSYYVGQSLALLANPATRAEGIRFAGTFLHLLQDRTATAHALPVDNFFEGLAQFIPGAEGKAIWMHSAMESLGREYKGLEGYAPLLLGTNDMTVTAGLRHRMGQASRVVAPLIVPQAEAIFAGDKDRSIALQIVAAEESTRIVADFLYTVIAVSQGKTADAASVYPVPAQGVERMAYDYPLEEVVAFCRERYAWGEGYGRVVQSAMQALAEVERIRLGPDAKRLARHDVYLPEQRNFADGPHVRAVGEVAGRYDGGSFHMPIDAADDMALFEGVIRLADGAVRAKRYREACEYLGIAAHAVIDRHSPVDLHVRHDYAFRMQHLLPAPERCAVWRKGSVLGCRNRPEIKGHAPLRLGESPAEIAFRLQLRFRNVALPLARRNTLALIRAIYRGERAEIDGIQTLLAEEAARTVADLFHSVLALSSADASPMGQADVSLTEVPERIVGLVPVADAEGYEKNQYDHYWRLRWSRPYCYRLWKNATGSLPTDASLIRPLELRVEGQPRVFPVGFAHGAGPEHVFAIPRGVYREFRAKVGCHPAFDVGEGDSFHFVVLLDGKRAYTSPPVTKATDCLDLCVPLGDAASVALWSTHTKGSQRHLVWADPMLCR